MKPYIIFILLLFLCSACQKFVELDSSPTQISSVDVFSNAATAESAVVGLYNQMTTLNLGLTNGGLSLYGALSADELYPTSSNVNYSAFYNNAIPSSNSTINIFWGYAYRGIYRANAILEGLDKSMTLEDKEKNKFRGEILFTRAFYYFYLVNLFGDVPLVLTGDYRENAEKGRTSVEEIYQQIVSDLIKAVELLASEYPSSGKVRPNRYTAMALLARVYLYRQQWEKAEDSASAIIESGIYGLEEELDRAFLIDSREPIWQLFRTANTAEAASFIPISTNSIPSFALSDHLQNAFEIGDKRVISWLNYNIVDETKFFFPYKYKATGITSASEYVVVFRLAEQYLIRAEARAEQGSISGAVEDLNIIRNRAGLPTLDLNNQAQLTEAIEKERFRELFAEWGHRWFDLKRTGRMDKVLSAEKKSWKSTAMLFPLPQNELIVNVFLKQNPGYEE